MNVSFLVVLLNLWTFEFMDFFSLIMSGEFFFLQGGGPPCHSLLLNGVKWGLPTPTIMAGKKWGNCVCSSL